MTNLNRKVKATFVDGDYSIVTYDTGVIYFYRKEVCLFYITSLDNFKQLKRFPKKFLSLIKEVDADLGLNGYRIPEKTINVEYYFLAESINPLELFKLKVSPAKKLFTIVSFLRSTPGHNL